MRASFVVCFALALPDAAFADCPVGKADLTSGIHLTSDGTETIRYRQDELGHVLVEDFPMQDFTFSYVATTMFGLYQLQEGTYYQGEVMPDSLASMAYAVPSGNLPEPTAGLAFHSPVKFAADVDDPDATMFVTVGLPVEKTYGECSYETLPVTARMTQTNEDYLARFDYIPSLGISIEWMSGTFSEAPSVKTNLRLSLTAPEGMPAP